jgi:hypothetical protein
MMFGGAGSASYLQALRFEYRCDVTNVLSDE